MMHSHRLTVVLLVTAAVLMTACGRNSQPPDKIEPAIVESIEGSEFNRIILTEKAAERLGIELDLVREEEVDGAEELVIPYAAVLYGLNGETWAYISPDPLTYVRAPITINYIEGDLAVLLDGPEAGTEVVTVGVAELFGTDTGVGK